MTFTIKRSIQEQKRLDTMIQKMSGPPFNLIYNATNIPTVIFDSLNILYKNSSRIDQAIILGWMHDVIESSRGCADNEKYWHYYDNEPEVIDLIHTTFQESAECACIGLEPLREHFTGSSES